MNEINDKVISDNSEPCYKHHYSEAEENLFNALGVKNFHYMEPLTAYREAVMKVFIENSSYPYVWALHRGVKAIFVDKIARMTPQFDSLITFYTTYRYTWA